MGAWRISVLREMQSAEAWLRKSQREAETLPELYIPYSDLESVVCVLPGLTNQLWSVRNSTTGGKCVFHQDL